MSKKVTFEIPGGESLKLTAVSGGTAYSDAAATSAITLPYAIQDDTVIYFADGIGKGSITMTVSDYAGNVVLTDSIVPGNRPVNEEMFRVVLTAKQRVSTLLAKATADYAPRTKSRAREILAGMSTPQSVYSLSTETPTVTAVNSQTTTITGGILRPPRVLNVGQAATSQYVDVLNDPNFTYGGVGAKQPQYGAAYPDYFFVRWPFLTGGSSQAARWRPTIRFTYTGQVFEMTTKTLATSLSYRLKINGRRVTENVQAITGLTAGSFYLLKVDLGSAAHRTIELELPDQPFGGIFIEPTATLTAAPKPRIKFAVFGDSITAGANGVGSFDTWSFRLADLLGADDCANIAIGGSAYGFLNPGAGAADFRNRLVDITTYSPDILVYFGSYNDAANVTTAARQDELQTEVEYNLNAIKAALPDTLVFVGGCYNPGTPTAATIQRADDAVKAAAQRVGYPFISLIDPLGLRSSAPAWAASTVYPTGGVNQNGGVVYQTASHTSTSSFDATKHTATSWIYGTGRVGATAGNGNADVLVSSDAIHLSLEGHRMFERRWAAAITAHLRSMATV